MSPVEIPGWLVDAATVVASVNGAAGLVWAPGGRPRVAFSFTIASGKIVAIELIADPEHVGQLELALL